MLTFTKSTPTRRERQLEAENRSLRDQLAALSARLTDLQRANEAAYRDQEAATGGARFDTAQPFGSEPRKLGTLWLKGGKP
ncbi:hypothetical protein ACWD25_48200 [Streptomyces sp. NPDC002920]